MKRSLWKRSLTTQAPASVILIRLMVGLVFISEGIQKFIYPGDVGIGRFEKIGLVAPEVLAYFVACFEIACGALLTLGLTTRLAAIPLNVIMLTAIVTTKRRSSSATTSGVSTCANCRASASGRWPTPPAPTGPCSWAARFCSLWAADPGHLIVYW